MKKIMSLLLLFSLFSALPVISGCSWGSVKETYKKTPLKTEAKGQGKTTYNYTYKGKSYVLILGKDGKFYAIDPSTLGKGGK
jgi:hypothetical protein